MDLTSTTTKKSRLEGHQSSSSKKPATAIKRPAQDKWKTFFEEIKKAGKYSAVLSLKNDYCEEFIPVQVKHSTALLGNLARDKPLSRDARLEECKMFSQAHVVELKVCEDVEAVTKDQSASATWFAFRAGRVTASTAHAACRTSLTQPSVSLVKKICDPEDKLLFKTWTPPESENVLGNVLGDTSDDEALQYCYRGGPESGDMVECSGQDCKGKWFHFGCANLKRRPKAKAWFCRDFKPRKK
ncbi:uncharacterized protein LOC119385460 [Rhipicephalus sanguineus]|uniref:uncharacterized protein LOC119385460 n=1 Tax=Rhipicephalus sanguineus TaxID=34632 RepID=UPI001896023B|nr:uncharacterized protein LOC119385460 [Rhipicephalus sanguineus]